jgi:ethanolamine utilization protein EutN
MIIGRVSGNVVATQKHRAMTGRTLLTVLPQDLDGKDAGDEVLAIDAVGAGVGDLVLVVVEGKSTSQSIGVPSAPANAAIIAIIDTIDLDREALDSAARSKEQST